MSNKKTETSIETPTKKKIPIRTAGLVLLGIVGVAHIGVLGHLINATRRPDFPVINFPSGDYSSYEVEATRDGYRIKYRANDPRVLQSEQQLKVDSAKRGLFGPKVEQRREYRVDQYTMDGVRNLGGAQLGMGKGNAKSEECIRADAGARSQGALAGTSIAAGALVPAVINIPYVGWLAAGWMTLLGQRVGSQVGSEVGSIFNDC
jgi:hypothetical protein